MIRRLGRPLVCMVALVAMGCAATRTVSERDSGTLLSLLGRPLDPIGPGSNRTKLEADLRAAQDSLSTHPNDPDRIIWVARRWGYLWQIEKSIDVLSDGIERHPSYAPLHRHRGHRYISARRFREAIVDLERAAELIQSKPDEIEQDGAPNDRNIPLTTTGFNVWYHLALAKYLSEDFEGAVHGFREAMKFGLGYDDNLVATTDWIYMALRRLGRDGEAAALLEPIHPEMEMIENDAYHRRLLMYKGLVTPEELLNLETASQLELATLGYGIGNWYLYNGDKERANRIFRRVVAGPNWPAFGYIAAEVELARQKR